MPVPPTDHIVRSTSQAPLVAESELPPLTHHIDGAFIDAGTTSATTILVNPADETTIAEVAEGSAADVDSAVAAARRALEGWRALTP